MAKFKIPADVSELDSDALAASVEEALAAFGEFAEIPDAEVTDEQFAEMSALHEYATDAQAEIGNRQAAADARAEHLAAVRQDMAAVGKPVEEGSPAEEEAETPAEEAAEPADPNEEEVPPKPAPKATAASRRSFTAQAAATAPVQKGAVKAPSGSLTAAADVSGFAAGHKFSNFADASEAIMSRLRSLPTDGRDGHIRNSALVINLPESKFTQKTKDSSEMLLEVASESRLSGGSLIAAGGWGAPSEHTPRLLRTGKPRRPDFPPGNSDHPWWYPVDQGSDLRRRQRVRAGLLGHDRSRCRSWHRAEDLHPSRGA